MRQAALQGTLPSLEFRAAQLCLAERRLVPKMSGSVSEQLNGDSFRTSFPQGGVLRHQLAHLELIVAAWLKYKGACSTLA